MAKRKIRIGELNTRIMFLKETVVADGYGGFTSTGNDTIYPLCWAKLDFTKSEITDEFGELQNQIVAVLHIRKKALTNGLIDLPAGAMFKIDSTNDLYKINEAYESDYKEYFKIIGTKAI